jgi:dihydropteroate synthase
MNKIIKCKDLTLNLNKPNIVGILNVTPDSFSDGGKFFVAEKAIEHAKQMQNEGADIIDIGGESTRPESERISEDEELRRVLPVLESLVGKINIPISIDTMKPVVADECLKRGAHIINDVSGLRDENMIEVVSKHNAPVVIMHMVDMPDTMQNNPNYVDVVIEIKQYLKKQAKIAEKAGIDQVIIDPGIGFGKTLNHNLEIIRRLKEFKELGYPIMVGPSRKSFIGAILDCKVDERLEGTLATVTACVLGGANIIRVHDVKECVRATQVAYRIAN